MTKTNFTKEQQERIDYNRREFFIALELEKAARVDHTRAVETLRYMRKCAADEYTEMLIDATQK